LVFHFYHLDFGILLDVRPLELNRITFHSRLSKYLSRPEGPQSSALANDAFKFSPLVSDRLAANTSLGRPWLTDRDKPPVTGGEVRRDISYHDGDPRRVLDVHRPEAVEALPAVILVHGGSWSRGNRRRMHRVAEKAVERGYAAVNIEYRLAPENRYPGR
jgi:acetyl esterase/lipase